MNIFTKIYKFNRFPIQKDRFFKLLDDLCSYKNDFTYLLNSWPRMYEKIYVTMSINELLALENSLGVTDLVEEFDTCDAIFDYQRHYIILHIPAMVRNLASIPTNPTDTGRRTLFTIHFFACLFHELSHAHDMTLKSINSWGNFGENSSKDIVLNKQELEDNADRREQFFINLLTTYLEENKESWHSLTEWLFNWDKLQKQVHSDLAYYGNTKGLIK